MKGPHTLRFRHLWQFADIIGLIAFAETASNEISQHETLSSWRVSRAVYTVANPHGESQGCKD
jgi:hypothetical protein